MFSRMDFVESVDGSISSAIVPRTEAKESSKTRNMSSREEFVSDEEVCSTRDGGPIVPRSVKFIHPILAIALLNRPLLIQVPCTLERIN